MAGLAAKTPQAFAAARLAAAVTANGRPNIQSAAALVVDLKSNTVLFERDADVVRPIASLSKIFGALVVAEDCHLNLDTLHEMTPANREAARGGDKTKLITGWSYSHRDLLHAALMRSDNRALPALAESCGLNPQAFAAKMTDKAQKLGLVKTTFKEPDGLSAENVSTAREVLVALKAAIATPLLHDIMAKPAYEITAVKGGQQRSIKIKNTDRLLTKPMDALDQILGGKTGYTDIARYCLAVAARTTSGQELGMVFLGAEGRFTRFADFTRVLRWLSGSERLAFAHSGRKLPSEANQAPVATSAAPTAAQPSATPAQDLPLVPGAPTVSLPSRLGVPGRVTMGTTADEARW